MLFPVQRLDKSMNVDKLRLREKIEKQQNQMKK